MGHISQHGRASALSSCCNAETYKEGAEGARCTECDLVCSPLKHNALPEPMLLECHYCRVRFESPDGAEQGEDCNECSNGIITIAVDREPTEAEEMEHYRKMECGDAGYACDRDDIDLTMKQPLEPKW